MTPPLSPAELEYLKHIEATYAYPRYWINIDKMLPKLIRHVLYLEDQLDLRDASPPQSND